MIANSAGAIALARDLDSDCSCLDASTEIAPGWTLLLSSENRTGLSELGPLGPADGSAIGIPSLGPFLNALLNPFSWTQV